MSKSPPDTLEERLRTAEATPASYIQLSREITGQSCPNLRPLRSSFLSTFNLDLIFPYLIVEAARSGILLSPWFGPFGQMEQQCFDPESDFFRSKAEIAVLGFGLQEAAPELVHRFLTLTDRDISDCISRVGVRFSSLVSAVRKQSTAKILFWNFTMPRFLSAGIGDSGLKRSQAGAIRDLNRSLAELAGDLPDVFIFDAARLAEEVGLEHWYDPRLQFLGRVPFGIEAQFRLARGLSRWFHILSSPQRKCLVVDLDNTLWGGIIGEDGMGGIELSEDFPGNVFKDFHKHLLELKDRGILLAIASKNNETDAMEVLKDHPDCVLRPDDFSAKEIHWGDKATSLRSIATRLNIGLDSLVFFDDNPVEREWVSSQLPEVMVIDVPDQPLHYADALHDSGAFDRASITREDKARVEMYGQEEQRRKVKLQSTTVEGFLKDLEITVSVGSIGESTITRCAQLTGKTNQFNLTTRRYSETNLIEMIEQEAIALWIRVRDRFGDQGLVGLAIAVEEKGNNRWRVDSFLLSCRVLGRKIETALLYCLLAEIEKSGGTEVIGEFLPSKKNQPAADFYQLHRFNSCDEQPNTWRLSIPSEAIKFPEFINLTTDTIE